VILMGKVNVVLEEKVEQALRKRTRKKGDISDIVNEALRQYLEKETQK